MVEHLLYQIMSPNTEFKKEVNICRSSHCYKFVKLSTYIYTVVLRLNPSSNPSSGRFRKCSIYATGYGYRGGGIGGSLNGRVCGRGLEGIGGLGR